jgi:hypothetical protein
MEVATGLSSFIIARILLSMTAEIDEFKDARASSIRSSLWVVLCDAKSLAHEPSLPFPPGSRMNTGLA